MKAFSKIDAHPFDRASTMQSNQMNRVRERERWREREEERRRWREREEERERGRERNRESHIVVQFGSWRKLD